MRVNLLGEKSKRSHLSISWSRVGITIGLVVLLFFVGYTYWTLRSEINFLEERKGSLDEQLALYRPREERYFELRDEIEELENMEPEPVVQLPWGESMLQLGYIVPENIMVQNLNINEFREIQISGIARTEQEIISLLSNMDRAPLFEAVDLLNLEQGDLVRFSIEAELVNRAGG